MQTKPANHVGIRQVQVGKWYRISHPIKGDRKFGSELACQVAQEQPFVECFPEPK